MDKRTKDLRSILLENPAVEIKESAVWYVPVDLYNVGFKRVKRSKMDILMKMILLSVEETDIRRAANLAEMLLVEELFIVDLIEKMERTGLIQLERSIYKLTQKGRNQLQEGIIEEELEEESTEVKYSSTHDEFWFSMPQDMPEEEEWSLYRYTEPRDVVSENRLVQVLSEQENGLDENGYQIVVSDVTTFEQQSVVHVPCLEFHLYNQEQDTFYARVWNTWLKRWDDVLEQQIEEHERVEWRKKYT
ncbi:hypothetical protein JCM9140_1407 [Halalkalibacter wakoensis JCM 9140]|uniref:Uncharacterized protein n=1 Tax=Halalkalibacter wakoensis JCM 9140 TaxID=1236970 RepID=W4Q241_9BACI|nr:hypothetical protein [Halalkalibacter wakoensis]GAE25414.1 hypothetical protein JCM9140_1407 [Halalkalibacter wakoensis JCM 9140]